MKKGAEANLYLIDWHGKKAIVKRRVPKAYRLDALDRKIRAYRTIHEALMIHDSKLAGVATPSLYMIRPEDSAIIMEYVEGERLKELFTNGEENIEVCREIGESLGKLHDNEIIHGDLTTSNLILSSSNVYFIDFGLSHYSSEVEDMGVDLHLMKRTLFSGHHRVAHRYFTNVEEGYECALGENQARRVFAKVREIERRGRYFAERQ